MAAVALARLEAHPTNIPYAVDNEDMDAEGEEDPDVDFAMSEAPLPNEPVEETEVSDGVLAEASGEEEDGDEEDDDDEFSVPSVKPDKGKQRANSEVDMIENADEVEESSAAEEEEGSDKESTDAESAVAEDWEAGSEEGEDGEVEVANRNNCIFCLQDEEHDPSEEFEEYMACAVCGDNSHRQCARDANSLASEDDAEKWRCPQCVDNALEPDIPEDEATRRRRSSASRLTRDLLPAQRGTSRPGSHSIFNTLIVEGDPLDGSRSLRKRKPTEEQEEATPGPSKRRKQSTPKTTSERSASAVVADSKEAEEPAVENVEAASTSTRKSRSSRPSRSRRLKSVNPGPVTITTNDHDSIIISIKLNSSKLASILNAPPKKKKRQRPSRAQAAQASQTAPEREETARPQRTFSSHYTTPFYAFHERENDDLKSKPYGGILSETDAETTKTLPLQADRAKFNEARQKAEEEWKLKTASAEAELETKGRSSQKLSGPPSKIKCVSIGGYEIETWYAAPYPEEYSRNRVLYICEFCLKYMNSDYVAWRHKLKCPAKHPPGDEIYRDKSVSVFEVDGRKNPVYCQNLCLLAKLFLGSKTLYYDVEPFLFYVMTEYDELGCHFVGYFSKEKRPSSQNNVSCILTLPTHQRKGYGNLLISFSYLLTRVEGKTGSPEKPLSDMGLVSYRNYWRLVLSYELLDQTAPLSITDLSARTGMTADDLVAALEGLRALVRDPITKTYALRLDRNYLGQCIDTWEAKGYVTLNPSSLVWTPYIMGRSNLAHYDHAPALPTIAPREGEDEDNPPVAPEEGVQQAMQQAAALTNGAAPTPNGVDFTLSDIPSSHPDTNPPPLSLLIQQSSILPPAPSPQPHPPTSTPINLLEPSVPPIRYEIFPPLPGGTSRRNRTTAQRSGATSRKLLPGPASPSMRRGKSLGQGNGTGKAEGRASPRLRGGRDGGLGSERKTRSSLRGKKMGGGDGAADSERSEHGEGSDVEKESEDEEMQREGGGKEVDEVVAGREADRQLVGEAGKGGGYAEGEKDRDFEADAEGEDDSADGEEEGVVEEG